MRPSIPFTSLITLIISENNNDNKAFTLFLEKYFLLQGEIL